MKITEKKMIEKEVTVGHKCDNCKKETGSDDENIFGFCAVHHEWQGSSEDSFEWHEVCSWKCFLKILPKIYDNYKKYPSTKINDMPLWVIKQIINSRKEEYESSFKDRKIIEKKERGAA